MFNNPPPGDVLTIMQWTVQTLTAGWYERMLMRIQFYNPATPYVPEISSNGVVTQYASIVYYGTTDKVYKCKAATTGNAPTDATYWEEVTDLSTLISNTNVSTTITNTYVRAIVDEKMRDYFSSMGAKYGCDDQQNYKAWKLNGLLQSANSAVASGNYDEMDKIIAYIEAQLVQVT